MNKKMLLLLSIIPGAFGIFLLGWAINKKIRNRKAMDLMKRYSKAVKNKQVSDVISAANTPNFYNNSIIEHRQTKNE